MHFQLTIKIHPRPDELAQTEKILSSVAVRTETLPGCILADLYSDIRKSQRLMLVQEWASLESLESHLLSESYRKLLEIASLAVSPPEIQIHQIVQTTDASALGT